MSKYLLQSLHGLNGWGEGDANLCIRIGFNFSDCFINLCLGLEVTFVSR